MWLQERERDGYSNEIYSHQWKALAPTFEHADPAILTADDFRAYARARFRAGRKPATVHTELRRLHACLRWAVAEHHIDRRPRPWAPSPGRPRQRVLTRAEAVRLVEAAAQGDHHVHLFMLIAFATGARHAAILDLTWDRVDFGSNTLTFDDDLPRDPMDKSWRKGRATVPMNRTLRQALVLSERGRQTGHVIEHGGARLKDIREGFRNAVKRAGLWDDKDRITPHVIRHTVATWLDEAAIERRRSAQMLGHRDERTTAQVYTHSGAEVLRDAVDALELDFAPLPKLATESGDEPESTAKSVPTGQKRKRA